MVAVKVEKKFLRLHNPDFNDGETFKRKKISSSLFYEYFLKLTWFLGLNYCVTRVRDFLSLALVGIRIIVVKTLKNRQAFLRPRESKKKKKQIENLQTLKCIIEGFNFKLI